MVAERTIHALMLTIGGAILLPGCSRSAYYLEHTADPQRFSAEEAVGVIHEIMTADRWYTLGPAKDVVVSKRDVVYTTRGTRDSPERKSRIQFKSLDLSRMKISKELGFCSVKIDGLEWEENGQWRSGPGWREISMSCEDAPRFLDAIAVLQRNAILDEMKR